MSSAECKKPLALVVDDDDVMRLMLSEVAIAAGFDVVDACDGRAALDRVGDLDPDLILLDVKMPGLDGYEVCAELRASPKTEHTPIVVVTGNDDTESVNRAYQCGATDFIAKPINWSLIGYRLRYVLRSAENIKSLRKREQKIERLAYFDSLTGLPNREFLREKATNVIDLAEENSEQVAFLYLDLDGFKRVNDTLGHTAGDEMLGEVAARLKEGLASIEGRALDTCLARIGGDEFAAVVRCADAQTVGQDLAALWIDMLSERLAHSGVDFFMTPSIGLALYSEHGTDFEHLLKNADTAMYQAKATGPGRYRYFSEQMNIDAMEKIALENGLRAALQKDALSLHYQPKFDVRTGLLVGAEALLRWDDPEHGSVSPARFIPIAEESGLIAQLDRWVVNRVCRQIQAWATVGVAVPVAVNLSATEFLHGDPVGLLTGACQQFAVDPSMIEIEITESTLMSDVERANEWLAALSELGFRLAVDDFGTGYSSLSYLKRFNVHSLKIDRSFVQDVATSPDDAAICSAIIALANRLQLSVIAEGVEDLDQYNWLVAHGCECVQGFFFGRPVAEAEFRALYAECNPSQALPIAV